MPAALRRLVLCLVAAVLAACLLPGAAAQGRLPRAPFVTTPDEVVERMLALAGTGAGDFVIDLGSGDGRIVIAAAAKFGAKGLGVDLDAKLVAQSRENARQAGVAERARFEQGNALKTDLTRATVVTIYLLPQLIDALQMSLLYKLQPGARVVTHAFAMKSWRPDRAETVHLNGRHPGQGDDSRIFLWIVPAQARGEWQAGDLRLRIQQNFQEIQAEAQLQGRALKVTQAKLEGTAISVSGADFSYQGQVAGNRITGELTRDGVAAVLVLEKR
jgi:precorrin-6B methylase 2